MLTPASEVYAIKSVSCGRDHTLALLLPERLSAGVATAAAG